MNPYNQYILDSTGQLLKEIGSKNLAQNIYSLSDNFIEPIEINGPIISSPNDLFQTNTLNQIKNIVKNIIARDSGEDALALINFFENSVFPSIPNLKQQPILYKEYIELMAMLKFLNLSIFSIKEIGDLIKDNIKPAIQYKIKIFTKFDNVLTSYKDFLMGGSIAESLAKALLSSKNEVGKILYTSENKNKTFPPTIENWLKDYINFSLSGGEETTGSIERIEYLQKNPSVQILSSVEKEIIIKILKLYDWLRYGGNAEEFDNELIDTSKHNTVVSENVVESKTTGIPVMPRPIVKPVLPTASLPVVSASPATPSNSVLIDPVIKTPSPLTPPLGKAYQNQALGIKDHGDGIKNYELRSKNQQQEIQNEELRIKNFDAAQTQPLPPSPPLPLSSPVYGETGGNKTTASGEADDLLTLNNKFRPAGVAGATPLNSTTLQQKLNQKNINDANGNNASNEKTKNINNYINKKLQNLRQQRENKLKTNPQNK